MENQRITLSKKMLKDALLALLKERSLMDISIKELCDRSGVNRSTFYRHYDNLYDLLSEIVEDIFSLVSVVNDHTFENPQNASDYISDTLSFFRDHDEYDPLISSESFAMDLLSKRMEEAILRYSSIKNSRYSRYLIRYLLSGSYSIIKDWIKSGRKEDVKVISDIIYTFTSNTVRS